MNEYERVIKEASRLNRSITVAQELRGRFLRYLLITSFVTAVLTTAIIFTVAYFTSDPGLPERVDRNSAKSVEVLKDLAEENHQILLELRRFLRDGDDDFHADAGETRGNDEGEGANRNSNPGGGKDPAPNPPPTPTPTPEPKPVVCITVLDRSQCLGG